MTPIIVMAAMTTSTLLTRASPRQAVGLDQTDRGGDDDRAESRLGQVLHGCGEEQQHQGDDAGGQQAGEPASGRPSGR